MYNEQFAANVRTECKKQKIAAHKLFEMCGVRKGLLYDIEKRGTDISVGTALAIANALNVSLDSLFGRHSSQFNNGGNIVNGNVENSSLTVGIPAKEVDLNQTKERDEMSAQLLEKYKTLTFDQKISVMNYIINLENKNKGVN